MMMMKKISNVWLLFLAYRILYIFDDHPSKQIISNMINAHEKKSSKLTISRPGFTRCMQL